MSIYQRAVGLKVASLAVAVMAVGLSATAVAVASPDVEEVIRKTEHTAYYAADNGRAQVTMTITDSQGRERKRRLTILRRDQMADADEASGKVGGQKYYVHLGYPSDLRGTVLMVWKHRGGTDDRWMYLPGLDLAKRIAASDKRTSFLGSDFFYEDISGRALDLDDHVMVEETNDFYVIRNTPKQPETVEFSAYTMWVHKATYLPIKAEFLDSRGEPYRVYEATKVETIEGRPTVVQSRMKDLALNQNTVLDFSRIKYDTDLPEEIFTERYLRNPPRKLLR